MFLISPNIFFTLATYAFIMSPNEPKLFEKSILKIFCSQSSNLEKADVILSQIPENHSPADCHLSTIQSQHIPAASFTVSQCFTSSYIPSPNAAKAAITSVIGLVNIDIATPNAVVAAVASQVAAVCAAVAAVSAILDAVDIPHCTACEISALVAKAILTTKSLIPVVTSTALFFTFSAVFFTHSTD